MKTRRSFCIIHSHGNTFADGNSARQALGRASIPLGRGDVRAVIDLRCIPMRCPIMGGFPGNGPFAAFVLKAAQPEAKL
ncbi:MAG: hypothetical protein P4L99_04975 [Chthoniobacter sp.]|nr:hypothetical protein [Chthoniobacter sp.]